MATITTLANNITGLSFRTAVNNNFTNLNSDKEEKTVVTTIANRVTIIEGDVDTNTTNLSTLSSDISSIQDSINIVKNGFADYNDSTTATTPIVVPNTSTYVDLTNDGAGAFTNKGYLPTGVTDVWNTTTNTFDFSELSLGDMLDIRLDIDVTTTAPSQGVTIVLEVDTNGFPFDILFTEASFKSAGSHKINRYNGIYIGSESIRTGGARFRIKSDDNASVVVNGWYVKITKR